MADIRHDASFKGEIAIGIVKGFLTQRWRGMEFAMGLQGWAKVVPVGERAVGYAFQEIGVNVSLYFLVFGK